MGKGSRKKAPPQKRAQATAQPPKRPARDVDSGQRPGEYRRRHGVWADPTGSAKSTQPSVDLAADMVGQLHVARRITDAEEQAARTFQAARVAYLAELPEISGYRSCIAPTVPGYDDGDGSPEVIAAYRGLEAKMTTRERSEVLRVCEENQRPARLDVLRAGLQKIGG